MAFSRLPLVLLALAPLGVVASACGTVTATVVMGGPDGGATDAISGGDDHDLGEVGPGPDAPNGFCATNGLITLPDGRCTGDIGKKVFLFAACACTTIDVTGTLSTDALNSKTGTTSGDGASIGADTSIHAESTAFVQGSMWAGATALPSGTSAIELDGSGVVTRQLHAGADLTTLKPFTIQGDVFVTGDIFAAPTLTCDGVVNISPGGNTANVSATGGIKKGTELVVDDPCDCSNPLSIPPIVAAFANANDDAAAGFDATYLTNAPATPIDLPCGRYYFDSIGGTEVSIVLRGRTAIFVAGDVAVTGSLQVTLAPGAELDLFIAGSLSLNGNATLGAPDAPARARVYVGGTSASISGAVKIGANVYAPKADMSIASDFEMAGALIVHSLSLNGNLTIHYDVSILNVEGCASSVAACKTCHDCAGTQACITGACTTCLVNNDCCAPLVCANGQCIADVK